MNFVPFNRPCLVGNEINNIVEAIERGQLSGDGYFTKQCNDLVSQLTGSKSALLTHSCTAALEMAAILTNIEQGDEVIMPSFTFVSTANAVVLRGGIPVFVDIDPETLNIDPNEIAKAISPRTRAIFVVHYAGFPADMDRIKEIARIHKLWVVEDAAQALGSRYKGRLAGSLGDLAAFSFHETKNIISGEGGALTINCQELVCRAEIIREKGTNRSSFLRGQVDKYTWVDVGSSFLPSELISAFLQAQLSQADTVTAKRLALFERYMNAFSSLEEAERVRRPRWAPECTGNGHMFYLLLRDTNDRDAFIEHLKEHAITAPFHYVPLHSAPAGKKYAIFSGDLNVTNRTSAQLVRLPLFFELDNEIDRILEISIEYLRASS
jgi:dTDP-4-amino-4,6-dideoxygalactose transaminase